MKKIALAAVLAPLMAGCASLQPEIQQSLQFNYVTSAPMTSGLVRVFSLNGNTVLQFMDLARLRPKVYAAGSTTPMPYATVGQYAVVAGQHSQLTIEANGLTVKALYVAPGGSGSSTGNNADPVVPARLPPVLQVAHAPLTAATSGPLTWTLTGGITLRDNLRTIAHRAGFAEPAWHARNPYMIVATMEYTGTFLEVLGHISAAAPQLDIVVDKGQRTIEVTDARS
ncbi:hypothetical protein RCH14_004764 [Massilia sp. MP_M2]|uniref:hypothetical protein n=1 Tax=Massilia sp. MP_M2 TaxID=3071713 RepID=UPI00319E1CC2